MRRALCLIFWPQILASLIGCAHKPPVHEIMDTCFLPEAGISFKCEPSGKPEYLLPYSQAVCFPIDQFKRFLEGCYR